MLGIENTVEVGVRLEDGANRTKITSKHNITQAG